MQLHPSKILGFLALVLTLLFGVSDPVNAQVRLITQNDCCPVTISLSGTYILEGGQSLTVNENTPAIVINSSNVTLVLDGQVIVNTNNSGIEIGTDMVGVNTVVLFCDFGGPLRGPLQRPSITGNGGNSTACLQPTDPARECIGIVVRNSSNVTVDSCTVTRFTEGFGLRDSSGNIFQRNRAENNTLDGFDLDNSNQNFFLNNNVRMNGEDGFDLGNSNLNIFTDNTVNGNTGNGFDIGSSSRNSFTHNTVMGNRNGFSLHREASSPLIGSDQNTFMLNTITNNKIFNYTQQDSMGNVCNPFITGCE